MISPLPNIPISETSSKKERFLLVSDQDLLLLHQLQPFFNRFSNSVVDEYHRHLVKLFPDHQETEALKTLLRYYLDLLVSGKTARDRIVPLQKQVNLAPKLSMAGYAFILSSSTIPLILEGFQSNPAQRQEMLSAFLKVLFIDISRVTEDYYQDACERCELRVEALHEKLADKTLHLESSKEGFRSIFENVSSPLCTYDKKGMMLRWNKPFKSLFDLEDEEMKGRYFFKVIGREAVSARLKGVIQAVFEGSSKTDVSCLIKSADGKFRYLSISAFPVFDAEGDVSFGIAMVHDITEKKELELALIRTEKMAAMGTLASGLAHEIGTPMNVILGRAESMLRATEEEKTAKGLMIVIEQIDRMTLLIERLLSFARRSPIERKKIDLNRLIINGIEICEQRAKAKEISFVTRLHPTSQDLWCDGDQILQVLVALFMNAVDAMYRGGEIKVQTQLIHLEGGDSLEASSHSEKNQMAQILVKDSGSGIDATQLDKIFDPFFTTKPVGKGTGLGLAVAHEIIQDHGGQIEVASTVGKGTTFCILLPVAKESLRSRSLQKQA